MVNISFPGIGIDAFSVNRIAFTIPIGNGIAVRWYGLIITVGILLAIFYASFRAKQEGIVLDDLLDMTIFTVLFAIVGARLYYVLFSLDKYDSFLDAIAIWNGGLAIYGAIIAGALTLFFVARYKKISVYKTLDMAAPAVMIGQILGRWGNFFNGEAHGTEVLADNPLYFLRMGLSYGEGTQISKFYHPTFLYESLWNLIGFLIINALYKKKKFDGQIVLMYATWYGFGRMLIEGLRTDSLTVGGTFRISQIIGLVCFIGGAVLLAVGFNAANKKTLAEKCYESVYSSSTDAVENVEESTAVEETVEVIDEEKSKDISDKLKNLFTDEENEEENEEK